MDTLDLLKEKILKSAIEGKLVPQLEGEPEALQIGKAPEEVPFDIPCKWKWIRLDSLTDYIQRGKSPKYSEVKKIPVVSQKCNQWSGFEIDKARFIDPDTISKYSEERKLQDLDLLWNSTGTGTIGRVAVYESKLNPFDTAVADSHVTVVRVDKELMLPKFLYWFLRSPFVQQSIESLADGSTNQKELATRTIKNVLVPVPPLEEQKRIVEKVKCLFSKIDVIQKSMDGLSQLGNSIEKQLLQCAISGKLVPQLNEEPEVEQIEEGLEDIPFEIPKKWKWVTLNSLSKRIHYGYTAAATTAGKVHLLRITDVKDGTVDWNDVPYCNISREDAEKYKLFLGDILIARTGGTIGKSFLVDSPVPDSVFASYLIRAIPDLSVVLPKYLMFFLRSSTYWEQLAASSRGTGQPNVNATSLGLLKIPLPPLAEQKRIVEKLDKLMLEIHKLKQP